METPQRGVSTVTWVVVILRELEATDGFSDSQVWMKSAGGRAHAVRPYVLLPFAVRVVAAAMGVENEWPGVWRRPSGASLRSCPRPMDVDDEYDLDHNVILLKNPGVQAEPRTPPPQTLRPPDAASGPNRDEGRHGWGFPAVAAVGMEDEMGGLPRWRRPSGASLRSNGSSLFTPEGGRTPCAPTP